MPAQRTSLPARRPTALKTANASQGFALLITITLLAFLVLLLVSLASLTRVETQVASNSQDLAKARQNALFALNIALGQLQKAAGPDQRVTATAESLANTHPSKKKWTGVWDTRIPNLADAPTWLVSQASPAAADAPKNDTASPVLAATSNSSATAVRLVGENSADITSAGNEIVVPLQDITSTQVAGSLGVATTVGRFGYWVGDEGVKARINLPDPFVNQSDTLSLLNRVGTGQRTAWELFSGPTSPTPATIDPKTVITQTMIEAQKRLLTAQQLKLLSATDASAPADTAATLNEMTKQRFHDYTFWSAGVQADVKNGGLKWDLSTAFDVSDALFQTSEFGDTAPVRQDATNKQFSPIPSFTPSTGTAPNVSFVFAPSLKFGGAGSPLYLRGPTWHLLRSHYLLYRTQNPLAAPLPVTARAVYPGGRKSGLGGQDNIPSLYEANAGYAGGQTDPNTNTLINGTAKNVPRPTQTWIVPYINRVFIRFGVKTEQKTVTTSAGTSATVWAVRLVMTPFVVLHNPYNTEVDFKSYSGKSSPGPGNTPKIAAQINLFAGTSFGLPLCTRVYVNGFDYMAGSTSNGGAGSSLMGLGQNTYGSGPKFKMLIPETVKLKAGEVKVLYPQTFGDSEPSLVTTPKDTTYITLNTTPNLQAGFVFSLLNGRRNNFVSNARYAPVPNNGNPNVNPPVSATVADPIDPTKALTAAEFTTAAAGATAASEIWCNDATDKIEVVMNPISDDLEIKYSIESADPSGTTTDDATGNSTDFSAMAYQLAGYAPGYLKSGSATGRDAYLAEYTRFSKVPAPGFQRADDYKRPAGGIAAGIAGSTKYFFALDFYTKAANHSTDRAARPFITSNPVAFEQFHSALGGQQPAGLIKGTSGFPRIMPAYQLDFVDLNPATASNLQSNMYIDSNGNAIWGPHNGIDGQAVSNLDNSSVGLPFVPLINIPSRPLTSLAEFQHATIGSYGYQPYFAAGNSFASPYIPPDAAINSVGYSGNAATPYFLFDLSYWLNDALWDKYFFSSLSQQYGGGWGNTDAALTSSIQSWATGTRTLSNSRMVPYNSTRATAAANLATLKSVYRQAAASLLTLGSFNINSRSIDAWTAILGAARGATMLKNTGTGAPAAVTIPGSTQANAASAIARNLPASNDEADSSTLSNSTWTGFATLTDAQIRQLAANIVAEITRRQNGTTYNHVGAIAPARTSYSGPFRSLGDFINRNLVNDLASSTSTGAKGALQAALDETTNAQSPNRRFFTASTYRDVKVAQNDSKWLTKWSSASSTDYLAGQGPTTSSALGYILQADILQQIGPFLSARSDTFTIRTYGESVNPATGETAGKAWCEAVVQRLPEYVDQADSNLTTANPAASGLNLALYDATPPYRVDPTGTTTNNLSTSNQTFGRRFKIVDFRWLSAKDI